MGPCNYTCSDRLERKVEFLGVPRREPNKEAVLQNDLGFFVLGRSYFDSHVAQSSVVELLFTEITERHSVAQILSTQGLSLLGYLT